MSERQRTRVESYLTLAAGEGARVFGGGRPDRDGSYVCPAVLAGVDNGSRIAQ